MEVLELIMFFLMWLGIVWFYNQLCDRYINLKSRVDTLEDVIEFMQERNDDD